MVKMLFILLAALMLASCSGSSWWGEKAPPPKVAVSPSTVSDCPATDKIIKGNETESLYAMKCLEDDVNDAWGKIQGSQKNLLKAEELDNLIERGILDISEGDKKLSKQKLSAVKILLGFNKDISREDTDSLIAWIKQNRSEIRKIYAKLIQEKNPVQYADLKSILNLSSSYLRNRNLDIPKKKLGSVLNTLAYNGDPESPVEESALVAYDVLGVLCPQHSASKSWNSEILAYCFDSLANDFSEGEAWLNFMLNQRAGGYYTPEIHESLKKFSQMLERRTSSPELDGFHPELWVALAAKMKAAPPEDFLKSLNAINAFEKNSNGHFLHPKIVNVVFRVIEDMHRNLLDALPAYSLAMGEAKCINGKVYMWRDCILPRDVIANNEALKVIDRVVSPHFGVDAAPVTGKKFKKILLYQALSNEIIRAFDKDGDGIISSPHFGDDEVTQLLGVALSSVDTISTFINNLKSRANGIALKDQDSDANKYDHLNMPGLARLVTLAGSDVLVRRTKEDRILLEKVLANIFNTFPSHSLQLDRDAMTAILVFVDSFGTLRDFYLSDQLPGQKIVSYQHPTQDKVMVDRPSAVDALPEILSTQFPRTYAACMAVGFERTCGIALDEVLPSADPGSNWTSAGDLDMLTLVVGSLENIFDSCDFDQNGGLSSSLWDGEDELDCTVSKITNIVKRLMESKLVKIKNPKMVKFVLGTVDSIFLTRSFAKAALVRGTANKAMIGPFRTINKEATLGSIYSLMAEILASDRVSALKKQQMQR